MCLANIICTTKRVFNKKFEIMTIRQEQIMEYYKIIETTCYLSFEIRFFVVDFFI